MSKQKTSSDVWEFFTKKGSGISICNLCGKNYKTGGGTTNLKNHLYHKHPSFRHELKSNVTVSAAKKARIEDEEGNEENSADNALFQESQGGYCSEVSEVSEISITVDETDDDLKSDVILSTSPTFTSRKGAIDRYRSSKSKTSSPNLIQPSITSSFRNQKSYEAGGIRESAITQSLLYMICKDNLPLSCTEKEGMKNFLNTAIPLYKAPSRRKITSLVEGKYTAMQAIVRHKISGLNRISLTTDIATVMNSTRSFIVLTAHYIDEEKKCMSSICLGVKNLTPHHNAFNICGDLSEMLESWNISKENIVSVTTDNGANIIAGVKMLLPRESQENSVHVSCLAHNINLVVSKALGAEKDIINIIEKIKNIVGYFKHSNVAQDDLRNEQKKEGKTDGTYLYLIQEVATRWNSTFYCLERFQLLSGHVAKILLSSSHKKAPSMLLPYELGLVEECLLLLRPFESATKDVSGEKYVSGSFVIPLINCIKTALQRINVVNDETQKLKEELYKQVEKRLDPQEKNVLLAAATILDPRFKRIHFTSPLNAANAIAHIKEQLRLQGSLSPPAASPIEVKALKSNEAGCIWSVHEEVAAKYSRDPRNSENFQGLPTELKLYLNQPILKRSRDPIQYWLESQSAFPTTFPVALKYLTILGASVPSERVVSTLNNVCSDHRSRLTPEHTNQLVFLGSLDFSYWKL